MWDVEAMEQVKLAEVFPMSLQQREPTRHHPSRALLVASPHLQGTPYDRQVVLLLQHSLRGSVGVLLNAQFQESLRQMRGRLAGRLRQGDQQRIAVPVGVMQWRPGQLEAEVGQGVWLSSSASFDELFGDHDDLWVDLVRHIGRSILSDALHIRHMPTDPTVN
jgi:putative transcriptional regulator